MYDLRLWERPGGRDLISEMVGLLIGAASGVGQFFMLSVFTRSITSGTISIKSVLFGVSQFFLPIVVLLCCALLFPKGLMWSAIGIAATLIGCSATRFILTFRRVKSQEERK